jgi:peptide/nickel transport system permease protein
VLVRRLLRHRGAMVGGSLLAVLVGLALFGPLLSAYDPTRLSQSQQLLPPSAANLMGTDNFGRDIWTRLLYGARISMQVGLVAVGIGALLGLAVGVPSGYFGGWYDLIIQRAVDVMQAFPGLLLALALVAMIGPSLNNAMLAVGIASVPGFARVARGAVLATKPLQYVEAARLIGAGHTRIMLRHVLPNILAPLIVLATTGIGTSIAATGALGFLGLGAQPPTPEWGTMLAEGRLFLRVAWWMGTFPGLAIALIVLAVNLLGDGLRDALDPRLLF